MLNLISDYIDNIFKSQLSFNEYFNRYVMKVQDDCIDKELSYMLNLGISSIHLVDRAIVDACKELDYYDI